MAEVQIKSVRNWHDDLIEFILMHPSADLRIKARHFEVSMSWISIVENSDAFKEKLASRRQEHFQNVSNNVVQKLEALADLCVDEMASRIDKQTDVPLSTLKEVGESALKMLGFGQPKSGPATSHTTNILIADKEALAEARARMAQVKGQSAPVVTVAALEAREANNANAIDGEILPPTK